MFLDPTNVDDSVRTWFMINVHNNTTYLAEYYNLTVVFGVLTFFDWSSAGDFWLFNPSQYTDFANQLICVYTVYLNIYILSQYGLVVSGQ